MSWRRTSVFLMAASMMAAGVSAQGTAAPQVRDLGQSGWDAIREGRHEDAAAAFARAIDAEPRNPSLHLGAGLASFLLGQTTSARLSLERALSLAPSLTPASLLLGDILYKNSDIAGAIQVYEAALPYAPDNETLHTRLDALRREAALHDTFFATHGTRFTVLFEGPADEALAARAIEVLDAAYWRVATALTVYPENVITVVLYTQEQFRDVTRSPQWAGGAYDGRIRVPVRGTATQSRDLERVLVHELVHALVQGIAPRGVPVWLHEGLAVMFERDGASWSETELTRSAVRLPLARLAGSFASLSTAEARVAYAQSADIVRNMFDRGSPGAVGALLQDIARGEPFAAAFERHFFTAYDDFFGSGVR
jgi:tetratricopeptide (TPR) repeat protein